jgi:hypothetical protein
MVKESRGVPSTWRNIVVGTVRPAHRGPTAGGGHCRQFRLGRSRSRAVAIDRQELPGAGDPAQLDAAVVLEASARTDDQVTDGAGDEDFACAGPAEDPSDATCGRESARLS